MGNSRRVSENEPSIPRESFNKGRIVALNDASLLHSSIAELGNCATSFDHPVEAVSLVNLKNVTASFPGNPCPSFGSDLVPDSCCSGNHSDEFFNDSFEFLDLERKSSEALDNNLIIFRETTPTSELRGAAEESSPTATKRQKKDYMRSFPAAKMPSRDEIEDFFAQAEKLEQKRFTDKYNFDIVKDIPLEGRYQWIRLKP